MKKILTVIFCVLSLHGQSTEKNTLQKIPTDTLRDFVHEIGFTTAITGGSFALLLRYAVGKYSYGLRKGAIGLTSVGIILTSGAYYSEIWKKIKESTHKP